MNPRQAKAIAARVSDARVEAAAEWLFKRVIRDRSATAPYRPPIPDAWPPQSPDSYDGLSIADAWRLEARELLAYIDAAQEAEDG